WTIIRAYDGLIRFIKELTLHKRFLCDLNEMLGLKGQSKMVSHDSTIKYVYDAHKEEKPLLTTDPSILNLRLPQSIRAGYHAIVRKSFGMLYFQFSLWTKYIHLFAETVNLLLINLQAVASFQKHRELAIAIIRAFAG